MTYSLEERNQLILDNQNLVHMVLQKYCRIRPNHDNYEDLFQTGIIGLIKALDNFNPELGFKLSTYAGSMIYGEIRRYRRDCCTPYGIVVPRPLKDKVLKAISEDQDISSWNMEEHNAYLVLTNQVGSLDHTIGTSDGDGSLLHEIIADELSYDTYEEFEMQDAFDKFLESIKGDKNFDIIEEYMYDRLFSGGDNSKGKDSGQTRLGKKYNLSQAQISRIIKNAGKRFKEYINN